MGGKRKQKRFNSDLGKALQKQRQQTSDMYKDRHAVDEKVGGESVLRTNLQSMIERNDLEEFAEAAMAAGDNFEVLRGERVSIIGPSQGIINRSTLVDRLDPAVKQAMLRIPRRPKWTSDLTKAQLEHNEQKDFLTWRRGIAETEEKQEFQMTPFEKNIEVWRQLWRVIERSDVVVQIVDGRNPLFYYCEDLTAYIQEVAERQKSPKAAVILLNKGDLVPDFMREKWHSHFASKGVDVLFFSAAEQQLAVDNKTDPDKEAASDGEGVGSASPAEETQPVSPTSLLTRKQLELALVGRAVKLRQAEAQPASADGSATGSGDGVRKQQSVIGFIGYPNVGKSTVLNALLQVKRVAVSSTPGKTKHFQTLPLNSETTLCDCPGLVMPNFTTTRSEMVLSGVLPVDRITAYEEATEMIASRIPVSVFNKRYGLKLDAARRYPAELLLTAYANNRGFMRAGANGEPDVSRSAKVFLKDYLNGKLLYCHQPPGMAPLQTVSRGRLAESAPAAHRRSKQPIREKGRKGPRPMRRSAPRDDETGPVGVAHTTGKNAAKGYTRVF